MRRPETFNPPKVSRKVNPKTAANALKRACEHRPALAIVLGSGFHEAGKQMQTYAAIPQRDLVGFPKSTVPGHIGRVKIGEMGGTSVMIFCGRTHFYEGYSLDEITFPIHVMAEYGIQSVLLTNAAGGINARYRPGDFMMVKDHINLMGDNPLRGPLRKDLDRFVDLTQTYDPKLSKQIRNAARSTKIRLRHGVYCAVSGPSYETPAEIRAFATLGADAIGMSTVPEAIVARQCGLRVAALSCITNAAAGISKTALTHQEVLKTGQAASERAAKLIHRFAKLYA